MYVFDATPLIYLATVDELALVTALDDECCLPERVVDEVVTTGLEAGHTDARRVERAIENGHFEVRSDPETALVERLQQNDSLSAADIAVIALAEKLDGIAVMDEQYGRDVADVEDIQTRGTAYIVLTAQKQGRLEEAEATAVIDDLLDAGWYCAPDLYAKIRAKIEAIG
jgi:predicted nucleic acid-binding protein